MKASGLLEAFGDVSLDRLVLNLGVGGEIVLTESDPDLPHGAVVSFHAEARVASFKVEAEKHIGRVILTIDAGSFVVDGVEMPVDPPATEPMIGPDGQVLVGQADDAGEGFAALEAMSDETAASLAAAALTPIEETPHPFEGDAKKCAACGRGKTAAIHRNPRPATVHSPENDERGLD